MRVAVIGGGRSSEHEVSLASAAGVANALDARHEVVRLTIDPDGQWRATHPITPGEAIEMLRACAVAFPMLHGPHGEDGTLAGLLELAGVPYVGSGVRAGAIAMDKWVTKLVAAASGVKTAAGVLLRRGEPYEFDGPVVVKPVASGSSFGVSLVRSADHLGAALEAAFALDDRVLIEEVVRGREIDVAVIRRPNGDLIVSPPLEIVANGIFDHDTKYNGSAQFVVPAPLGADELDALDRAAVAIYDALGCAGVARIDFFLADDGPVLNEVNTMPGFTSQSQVPRMFAAAGVDYPDLLELLAQDALA
ncbi:D-alanine--D-alanine ligase family protein [soil metagenome]